MLPRNSAGLGDALRCAGEMPSRIGEAFVRRLGRLKCGTEWNVPEWMTQQFAIVDVGEGVGVGVCGSFECSSREIVHGLSLHACRT